MRLYKHQLEALTKIKNGCILVGGVGSGKSITSLAYYYIQNGGDYLSLMGEKYVHMKDPPDLYIITTAQKRDNLEWEGELSPFLLSTHDDINLYSNKVVIDSWNNIKKYDQVKNAFFIFDEQRVCGSGAWVKAFLRITKSNKWILLSATPGDTWMDYVPVFIANGFYRNRTEFIREHVVYSRFSKFPMVERYINTGKLIKLRRSILVEMDFKRSTKRNNIDIYTEYDKEAYRKVMKSRWNIYKDQPITNASELCYTLRKVINSDKSRAKAVLDIFNKHKKVIIFYNFDYELEILRKIKYGKGVKIKEWNGHNHDPLPDGPKWVYLVQYTSGNAGWNCIKTDTIIFYSQNYSYKVMQQASGRIDRLNTPFFNLYYYHLKTHSPIDLAISRALKDKKKFNETGWVNNRK